ncbi:MAG: NnrS family protein, partial [Alphaproteobacteria bacterium]
VASVHGWRMRLWHTYHSIIDPLLWILHAGYLWMIVGMILWFFSTETTDMVPLSIPLHLITIGCIGSLCLGMMARVTLGHTGRPLKLNKLTEVSFVLLQLSVLSRFFGAFFKNNYAETISISGILWITAFILYGIVFMPMLYSPRVDEISSFRIIQK